MTHFPLGVPAFEDIAHISDFLLQHMLVLSLRDAITEVVNVLRQVASTNALGPVNQERHDHVLHIGGGYDLNTVTVGLTSCTITSPKL